VENYRIGYSSYAHILSEIFINRGTFHSVPFLFSYQGSMAIRPTAIYLKRWWSCLDGISHFLNSLSCFWLHYTPQCLPKKM